ncbi:hypothetical protein GCM10010191_48170 [Actinomadura vinacea]|uniref:DUF397 domain-containing protein n=1 Tax=Actinomadura vinacea TaxID=115336 RepID=A0ABN3JFX2_9ACTN
MITWRKASHSGSTTAQSDCVELAQVDGAVAIRDSKAPDAGHLILAADAFARLVIRVKQDDAIV